jgi:hypothetical protein
MNFHIRCPGRRTFFSAIALCGAAFSQTFCVVLGATRET